MMFKCVYSLHYLHRLETLSAKSVQNCKFALVPMIVKC